MGGFTGVRVLGAFTPAAPPVSVGGCPPPPSVPGGGRSSAGRGLRWGRSAGAGSGRCWGFPVSPIVSPCRAGPSRALPAVASLRDGLRPPLTDRPATEIRGLSGSPQRDGPGDRGTVGASGAAGRSPGRPRSLRAPARWRLRPPVAGHGPPTIATCFCETASATPGGWAWAALDRFVLLRDGVCDPRWLGVGRPRLLRASARRRPGRVRADSPVIGRALICRLCASSC